MKRIIVMVLMMSLLAVPVSYADQGAGHKLYRGVVNIVTSPVEIPKQARAYWIKGAQKTDHIIVWIVTGGIWGGIQGIKRLGSGIWDVVSFPVEKPAEFKPLFKPSYVFDEWPRNPKS